MNETEPAVVRKQNVSTVEFVIGVVKDWIAGGAYRCGDKLPSEAELVAQTGASRSSVREAMKILSAVGLVEIKRGNGTYITGHADHPMEPAFLIQPKTSWTLKEVSEFREMIERSVVEMVIRAADEEAVHALDVCNNRLMGAVEEGLDRKEQFSRDLEFHRRLGSSTGNQLFTELYGFMMEFVKDYIEEDYDKSASMGHISYLMHQRILDAIRYRDLEMARQAVYESTRNFVQPSEFQHRG